MNLGCVSVCLNEKKEAKNKERVCIPVLNTVVFVCIWLNMRVAELAGHTCFLKGN